MHEQGGPTPLRRRLIAEHDVAAVVALLAAAFPRRSAIAWRTGLERLGRHQAPHGLPRYGVLLQSGERIVGVLLTICGEVEERGRRSPRCHLSSWFVDQAFAAQASLLLGPLLRRPDVTLINVSPAAQTEPIIAAQGFRVFCRGSLLVLPALVAPRAPVRQLKAADAAVLPERELLDTHLAWGCACLAVEIEGHILPFVFARARRLRGVLPVRRLLFCRTLDDFAAHAGALGRALLRSGTLGVLVDTAAPIPTLRGRRVGGTQGRYWRGPQAPRPGDLAYGEAALFPD